MTTRHTVDSITSDDLDQLYDRAVRAEAAIERVRAWIVGEPVTARSEFGSGYREALRDITDRLDEQQPTAKALHDEDGTPICTCTHGARCPTCQAEQPTT